MMCRYYRADIERTRCWYFVAIMRSFEYTAFDRTYDVATSTFEFFVPPAMDETFHAIMRYFIEQHIVFNLVELPNRLHDDLSSVW